ncbi:MAG TPA: hypothetical protein VNA20_10900 [Frankiaceae bacterium]|nr:hypothetical protein [Frankiaceae bacterium]
MKTLVVVAALTATLSPVLPAVADPGAGSFGRCGHTPVPPPDAGGGYQADLYAAVALYSTTPGADPVSATVTCQARVDSAVADSVSESGTAAVVVHGAVAFTAPPGTFVELCTVVDYAGATPTTTYCQPWGTTQLPPQEPLELADRLLVTYADPVVCPAFKARAPGAGPVFINEQGDVYVNGSPQWDCPPYDIWGSRTHSVGAGLGAVPTGWS